MKNRQLVVEFVKRHIQVKEPATKKQVLYLSKLTERFKVYDSQWQADILALGSIDKKFCSFLIGRIKHGYAYELLEALRNYLDRPLYLEHILEDLRYEENTKDGKDIESIRSIKKLQEISA